MINVIDLMRLQPDSEHHHGMPDAEFDALFFTTDRPIIFACHGYPWAIHRLAYGRTNHSNIHVRGYKEEETTTTPFDIVMLSTISTVFISSWMRSGRTAVSMRSAIASSTAAPPSPSRSESTGR